MPPAEPPEQNVVRTQKPKKKSRTSAEVYATSVYVLSVAAHHPAGSRAVVPTPPSPALPAARTPSPALATRRSITSLTHTRGASPAPQFDAQSAPPTIPRAPPKPSRERVLSHVGFESFPTTRSRSQQDPSRPAAQLSLHGAPAQQSLSITARTTARRRQRRQVLHAQQDSAPNFQPPAVAAHHPRSHMQHGKGRHIFLPAQLAAHVYARRCNDHSHAKLARTLYNIPHADEHHSRSQLPAHIGQKASRTCSEELCESSNHARNSYSSLH